MAEELEVTPEHSSVFDLCYEPQWYDGDYDSLNCGYFVQDVLWADCEYVAGYDGQILWAGPYTRTLEELYTQAEYTYPLCSEVPNV